MLYFSIQDLLSAIHIWKKNILVFTMKLSKTILDAAKEKYIYTPNLRDQIRESLVELLKHFSLTVNYIGYLLTKGDVQTSESTS